MIEDIQTIIEQARGKGYYLLPKSHPASPGYTGLAIAVTEKTPTEGFAPAAIRIRLREKSETAGCWTILKAFTPVKGAAHACPGQVTAFDLSENRKLFFTFGASLESVAVEHGTVYLLSSPAPILEMAVPGKSVAVQLGMETEAMIARAKAKWGPDDEEGFAGMLDQVDAFEFYVAAVEDLLQLYRSGDCPATDSYRSLCDALHQERAWLMDRGKWPKKIARFEDLLAAP